MPANLAAFCKVINDMLYYVLITFFICRATLVDLRSKSFESLNDIFPGGHTSRLM